MGAVDALDCQGFGSGRGPVRGMPLFPKIPNRWEMRLCCVAKSGQELDCLTPTWGLR